MTDAVTEVVTNIGLWSLLPLAVTLVLAFVTRSALIAMLIGTFAGSLMLGSMPGVGLNELFQSSLGNENFIWICEIVLLTGAIIRPLSDKAKIPREKLEFILDSTTSSVCILVPFTAWGAYLASLIAAQGGPIGSVEEALVVYINAIAYNFYPMLMLLFTLLICAGVLPDFGPMRKAERRVIETGALIRPGSSPLAGGEDELGPGSLVALTFFMTAAISFATGTSWGSYALMIPVALPLAFSISGIVLFPGRNKT